MSTAVQDFPAEKQGARVLLIDGEEFCQRLLGDVLPPAGYTVYRARKGEEALRKVQLARPDMILLDPGLPDMDGKDVIRNLRQWTSTPIIVLSVRQEESEKISSLDTGANDYLTKPFSVGELLARMRVALRTANSPQSEIFTAGDLKIDFGRREVMVGRTQVKLTATEYDLLKVLVHHAGKVRTHHQLIHELWGGTHYQDAVHLLRVTLSHLRRKLDIDPAQPSYIATEPGVGYRLRIEDKPVPLIIPERNR